MPTTPPHDESKPRRRWPTYLAVVLVPLLVLYPFSIGPAFVVAMYIPDATPLYQAAYYPLIALVEAIGADGELTEYCNWWLARAEASSFPPRF
jgi:hypothetical protein